MEGHLGCNCSNPEVIIFLNNVVEWRSLRDDQVLD